MKYSSLSENKWRVIGPGGGGAQFIPTISPHDPNTMLIACDMTAAYITHNGGESWRQLICAHVWIPLLLTQ
jgi:photosystem II stability/assembly factor-like uncharacterized protein